MISPDPSTHMDDVTGAELLEFLHERGHTEIKDTADKRVPIEKVLKRRGRAGLTGVVQCHRLREWAAVRGARP